MTREQTDRQRDRGCGIVDRRCEEEQWNLKCMPRDTTVQKGCRGVGKVSMEEKDWTAKNFRISKECNKECFHSLFLSLCARKNTREKSTNKHTEHIYTTDTLTDTHTHTCR